MDNAPSSAFKTNSLWTIIILAVFVAGLGLFSYKVFVDGQQKEIADLIRDLSSSGDKSRMLGAISTAESSLLRGGITMDTYMMIIARARESEEEEVRTAARTSIAAVTKANPPLGRDILRDIVKLPGRVSIRMHRDANEEQMKKLVADLRDEPALLAQGKFYVDWQKVDNGTSGAEVRCFSDANCKDPMVARLINFFRAYGITAERKPLNAEYENVSFMKNVYEVWLPPGIPKAAGPQPKGGKKK